MHIKKKANQICILIKIHIVVCFIAFATVAGAWPATVIGVTDGDTLTVLRNGASVTIRLHGIDCPEGGQAYGKAAKKFTSSLSFGKDAVITPLDIDKYGRTVAIVSVDNHNISEELVKNGYAWVFDKYCDQEYCSQWRDHQNKAIKNQYGMWKDSAIIPPWEWRKQKAMQSQSKTTMPILSQPSITHISTSQPVSGTNSGSGYHGNTKSHKFHQPGCNAYNCKNCTAVFSSRDEAISAGYVPCKNCNP